eukprot:scaffold3274_cov244-Pinguiococcus_pyrenoidosus.AAC.4
MQLADEAEGCHGLLLQRFGQLLEILRHPAREVSLALVHLLAAAADGKRGHHKGCLRVADLVRVGLEHLQDHAVGVLAGDEVRVYVQHSHSVAALLLLTLHTGRRSEDVLSTRPHCRWDCARDTRVVGHWPRGAAPATLASLPGLRPRSKPWSARRALIRGEGSLDVRRRSVQVELLSTYTNTAGPVQRSRIMERKGTRSSVATVAKVTSSALPSASLWRSRRRA